MITNSIKGRCPLFWGRGVTQKTYHAEGVINNEAAGEEGRREQNCNLTLMDYANGIKQTPKGLTNKSQTREVSPSISNFTVCAINA